MTRTGRGLIIGLGLTLAIGLAWPSAVTAQATATDGWHHASHLGGPTAFYAPPLKTATSLKQMAARAGMAEDIRKVLQDSGIPQTTYAVLATLSGAASSVRGGNCDAAEPADGVIVECDVQPGTTLLWMAYRPGAGAGNRSPGRLDRVRWAGARPFKAFLFRVTNDYKIYTFILPLECANLSLMSITPIPGEPIEVRADQVCDTKTGTSHATITASGKDLQRVRRVSVAIDGRPAGELTAPLWTMTSERTGEYAFDATDASDAPYPVAKRTVRLEACPPPPPPPPLRVVGPTCSISLSFTPVRGAYDINIDATRSTTGASGVAPAVTVVVRNDATSGAGQTVTLDSSLNGRISVRRPGIYRGTATVTTPSAVEVGPNRYEGSATCEATVAVVKPASRPAIFFDVLPGKDRRVRPSDSASGSGTLSTGGVSSGASTGLDFAQCSPLIGLKFGIAKRLRNDWEVAGTLGVGLSLVNGDQKVRESELFVDAEVNKYLSGGVFVGTGLSIWDITRSDTWTPAWLLHAGIPLTRHAKYPVYLVGEGRLFFDHIDDISNNYQVWGGVRVLLGR